MKWMQHAHRNADIVLEATGGREWVEVQQVLRSINGAAVQKAFRASSGQSKSLSKALNHVIRDGLITRGWSSESPIFKEPDYRRDTWRLDFAKGSISIEVAFNHSGSIAWNLLKPCLASELNHVEKAVQTRIGIVICATAQLRAFGGFDAAVGTYEQYVQYLRPMQDILRPPILIVGLEPIKGLKLTQRKMENGRRVASIQLTRSKT